MSEELIPKEKEQKIPHRAVIQVRAIVNQQMNDGFWHPASTHNDGFTFSIYGNSGKDVVEQLENLIKGFKELCQKHEEENCQQ
jgi:hypothetical protein